MPAGGARWLAALLVLAASLFASAAHAEVKLQPADPTAPPAYVPPGATINVAPAPAPREPVTHKWWFWTAVGAAVVTTVVVVAVVSSGEPSPPASTLGNMNAFMGH
jgi:hypothetical protein